MQYMILIYEDEKKFASLSEAEMNRVFAEYMQYSKDLAAAGVLKGGAGASTGRDGHYRSCPRRQDGNDRWTVCRDQGTARRLLHPRRGQPG